MKRRSTKPTIGSQISDHAKLLPLATGAGLSLTSMHVSAVITILPVISKSLGNGGSANGEWLIIMYSLSLSMFLLVCGRISDTYGHKRIYLCGLWIYIAVSALCALVSEISVLIVLRALQGIGAAMLSATATAIIGRSLPAQQIGRGIGWQAALTYLGLVIGPALGGFLSNNWTWRLVFLVNVLIGIPALWAAYKFIPEDQKSTHSNRSFDLLGSLLWSGILMPLLMVLSKGESWGWASPRIIIMLALTATCFFFFIYVERRAVSPIMQAILFRNFTFSAATLNEMIYYCCTYAVGFLLPILLIRIVELNPFKVGLLLMTQSLARTIVAPFSGLCTDRIGSRVPVLLGMTLLAVSLISLAQVSGNLSIMHLALSLALMGVASGLFVPGNTSALLHSTPREYNGSAIGILSTARNLGMTLGTTCAATIYASSSGVRIETKIYAIRVGIGVVCAIAILMLAATLLGLARKYHAHTTDDVVVHLGARG